MRTASWRSCRTAVPRCSTRWCGKYRLDKVLTATISIDSKRMFKPSPEAYTLIQSNLR